MTKQKQIDKFFKYLKEQALAYKNQDEICNPHANLLYTEYCLILQDAQDLELIDSWRPNYYRKEVL